MNFDLDIIPITIVIKKIAPKMELIYLIQAPILLYVEINLILRKMMLSKVNFWDEWESTQKIRKCVKGKLDYARGRWNNYWKTIDEFVWIFWRLLGIISLSIIVILIAKSICGTLFLQDNVALFNATLFQDNTNATLLSVCVNVMLTTALVLITASYASDTRDMLTQSKKEQRIRYIEKRLESFYIPVQDILEDPQYNFKPLQDLPGQPHYEYMVVKYKDSTSLPCPHILYNMQVLFYHVQAKELKKFSLYRYLAEEKTASLFVKYTSMESYKANLHAYKDDNKKLIEFVKVDFDKLLEYVKKDIKDYQAELNQ
jgi:hypothetical protein